MNEERGFKSFVEQTEEQNNLVAIMEKNEKILNLSQVSLAKDKQILIQELKSTENLFKAQVKSLSEENKTYQLEVVRLNQKIGILTEKLEEIAAELKKSKEKNEIISQSLLESNQKLVKFQEKYVKLDRFYKGKEEKLQGELGRANTSLTALEQDFSKKLENLIQKPVKVQEKNLVSKDQITVLIEQKKVLEKNFLQEKNSLIQGTKTLKKRVRDLEKELNKEKTARVSCETQIQLLKDQESKAYQTNEDRINEVQIMRDHQEKVWKEKILQLELEMAQREEELIKTIEGLQEEFEDYKVYAEELLRTQSAFKDFSEILEDLANKFKKIKNIKKSINLNLDCVGKVVKDFYSVTPYSVGPLSPTDYSSEHLKAFQEVQSLIKSIKNYQDKLETQAQTIVAYFEEHTEELINQEKQKIQDFVQLSSENLSLSTQIHELTTKKPDPKDPESKKTSEILQDLLQSLKKKINSFKVKQNSELSAWVLRENLYKRTIQSLNSQLSLQNSQFIDYKKILAAQPGTLEMHLNELQKELFNKNLKIEILSQDLENLHESHREAEEKFRTSIQMTDSCNRMLVEFYSTGLDLIERLKTEISQ